uniref:F-box protein 40, tandem duplicate 2 n=1 Tax=Sphaeramia orbicularis TaxID=375764 RepID=A0A673BVC6_9TELE
KIPYRNHRSRASRRGHHVHCDSCYNRRCRARVEVSVSCAITSCRLLCGAVFHLCKEEDHLLLCPNVRVPCLNAEYGCPLQMTRSSRGHHLQVCPASVVCCSMDWLRWPTDETNPHSFIALQENVLKENEEQEEALDIGMALVDQSDLYARLKMKPLYPELMEAEEEEEQESDEEKEEKEEEKEEEAVGVLVNGCILGITSIVSPFFPISFDCINLEKYNICEMMFGMERGACAVAETTQNDPKENEKQREKEKAKTGKDSKVSKKDHKAAEKGAAAAPSGPEPDTSKTGHAPWQEGVLERVGRELTPGVPHVCGASWRMLVAFGQIEACTPREKDFVYGSLEPIPVQTLRSFKVPDSYHYRQRVHLYDTAARAQSEPCGVDTSDLGASEQDWYSDEAAATLLGYAENDVMGHKISESKAADGLYIDVGTQTHSFRSAPFKAKTTLADVTVDKPLKLRLQLQAESVNSRHSRAGCAFSFICGHTFHRRESNASHRYNVHALNFAPCLLGMFTQRCPLSYLGCIYSQRRFQPSTHKATVSYNQELKTFNLRPTLVPSLGDNSPPSGNDALSSLPYEVLCHMASFLDSLSLSQLALVSRLMRQVCSSLLEDRGMVVLRWEKKSQSRGGTKWRAKPVWEFSHLFSTVDSWHMADIPPISAHLKVCPYYEKYVHSDPFPLPSMNEKQGSIQERQSLVSHFTANKRKQ